MDNVAREREAKIAWFIYVICTVQCMPYYNIQKWTFKNVLGHLLLSSDVDKFSSRKVSAFSSSYNSENDNESN